MLCILKPLFYSASIPITLNICPTRGNLQTANLFQLLERKKGSMRLAFQLARFFNTLTKPSSSTLRNIKQKMHLLLKPFFGDKGNHLIQTRLGENKLRRLRPCFRMGGTRYRCRRFVSQTTVRESGNRQSEICHSGHLFERLLFTRRLQIRPELFS